MYAATRTRFKKSRTRQPPFGQRHKKSLIPDCSVAPVCGWGRFWGTLSVGGAMASFPKVEGFRVSRRLEGSREGRFERLRTFESLEHARGWYQSNHTTSLLYNTDRKSRF